jgi:hypothetical protein
MTQEKPLKGISDDIATYLGMSPKAVAKVLKDYKVPTFQLGRFTCCYASTLKKCLEGVYWHSDDPSTDPPLATQ